MSFFGGRNLLPGGRGAGGAAGRMPNYAGWADGWETFGELPWGGYHHNGSNRKRNPDKLLEAIDRRREMREEQRQRRNEEEADQDEFDKYVKWVIEETGRPPNLSLIGVHGQRGTGASGYLTTDGCCTTDDDDLFFPGGWRPGWGRGRFSRNPPRWDGDDMESEHLTFEDYKRMYGTTGNQPLEGPDSNGRRRRNHSGQRKGGQGREDGQRWGDRNPIEMKTGRGAR